jgi:hypoxanthine-DNA glycosylase
MTDDIPKRAFAPVVDRRTRVLILGSLPGDRSLGAGEYYAHPSNAFWWLMGEVLGDPGLLGAPYSMRLSRLLDRGIGLWDVIGSGRRTGSLDSAIRDASPRDVPGFAASLPQLQAIAFNGGLAARHGRRQVGYPASLQFIDLPSSSAAHAGIPRTGKLAAWREIYNFLG